MSCDARAVSVTDYDDDDDDDEDDDGGDVRDEDGDAEEPHAAINDYD